MNWSAKKDYIYCKWNVRKETPEGENGKKISLIGNALADAEAELNGINEVVAVGPDVKDIKVGEWVMLTNTEMPIINIDGEAYMALKDHMVMLSFDEKPEVENCKNPKDGSIIRTKKTEKKALEFRDKYKQ